MSRQLGSLHRSNSHPANLQTQIPITPLFAFPPPDSPIINIPSSMNSDTNSDISVFHTISQFTHYNYTNPLCLPLANTTENMEKKQKYTI